MNNSNNQHALEQFRKKWPKIAEHVCPELMEAILEVKTRRKWFGSSDSVFGVQMFFGILTLAVIAWYFLSPQTGTKGLVFQLFFWSIAIFGRRQRRISGPFSLTRVFSERDGQLAPDLWLTGLSYAQIAATDAAASYTRRLPLWRHLVAGAFMSAVLLGVCWMYGLREPIFLGLCGVAIVLFAVLQRGMASMFRVKQRLGDIYIACSLENNLYRPFFTGAVSAKGRWSRGARLNWTQVVVVVAIVAIGLLAPILMIVIPGGGLQRIYIFPACLVLMMLAFSLLWRTIVPHQVSAVFENTVKDGQARFEQLVEKVAEREAA